MQQAPTIPTFTDKLKAFGQLMRVDRPIGTYLLLWPTFWALWIAADGFPAWQTLLIFTAGVYLTRAAGCVINDYADRKIDGHVKRTRERPLPSGKVTPKEALILFASLMLTAFMLVLLTNTQTIMMSFAALALAASYPFMKRYTHLPQVVLGAAFSWAIPMSFTAVQGDVPGYAWLLFMANLLWTVAYDTMYAMVDRDDDLKIGVKSTAVLFGNADRLIIGILQLLTLVCLLSVRVQAELGFWFDLAMAISATLFIYQQWLIRARERAACFTAFLNNHYVGMVLFIGIVLHYAPF
ncbi:MAG: 4-hydroxybenzoate octaprenyltransferase [Marinobacterium sp.]|nr:4-hydroxybenzoate octaprenyltransferase [Marinobacterium sp.]